MKKARRIGLTCVTLMAAWLVAGCPGMNGKANVVVTCVGDACGKAGTLHVWLADCAKGDVLDIKDVPTATLTAGVPITEKFTNVANKSVCAKGFLDRDLDDVQTPGDVYASIQPPAVKTNGSSPGVADLVLDTIVSHPQNATVYLDIACSGAGCVSGSGSLYGYVATSCTSGATVLGFDVTSGATISATPSRVTISDVPPGPACGLSFLDLGTDGLISSGDAYTTTAAGASMTLSSGQIVTKSVTIDAVAP